MIRKVFPPPTSVDIIYPHSSLSPNLKSPLVTLLIQEKLPKEIAYCIPKNSNIMLEKIEKKLKKFNGKVIGYEFKKTENKRITEISKTNFDNASSCDNIISSAPEP